MSDIFVSVISPSIVANIPGTQGPPGPPGDNGEAPTITATAGENLSAGRAVVIDTAQAYYFQPTNPAHIGRVVGVTKTSATAGASVNIQTGGIVTDAAFTFAPDLPIFSGNDGELTETPPAAGIVQKVGVSIAANQILLNINTSLKQT